MKRFIIAAIIIFIFNVLFLSCAQIGSLTGGDKDTIAPIPLRSLPGENTTNYKGKKVIIAFNEYLQLKNLDQTVVISPPQIKNPEFLVKNKKLVIKFKEPLKDSVTYTLFFGDAVCDFHESNPIPNFSFAFATGNNLDSLTVMGSAMDVKTGKPAKNFTVGIYSNFDDSVPYKKIPDYIARTDSFGNFTIKNIKFGKYKAFGLVDMNTNYLYDLPNEQIAFSDLDILPSAEIVPQIDTLKKGTIIHDKATNKIIDTLRKDSILVQKKIKFYPDKIFLRLFEEDNKKQFITKSSREKDGVCFITLNKPIIENFIIKPLYLKDTSNWAFQEIGTNKDSITIWLNNKDLINSDTVALQFNYISQTVNSPKTQETDTIYFLKPKKTQISEKNKKPVPELEIILPELINAFDSLFFTTPAPINTLNLVKIKLFEVRDTTTKIFDTTQKKEIEKPAKKRIEQQFVLQNHKNNIRLFYIKNNWIANAKYELVLDSASFTDIYSKSCWADTLTFTVRPKDVYGKLKLNITNTGWFEKAESNTTAGNFNKQEKFNTTLTSGQLIIQILNAKNAVIYQKYITGDQEIKIANLLPEKYKLRIIHDLNKNGVWDTGIFKQHLQPEQTLIYLQDIQIESKKEAEVKWNIAEKQEIKIVKPAKK